MTAKHCPACGRFMATEPEKDIVFEDGSGVTLAPVTHCTREECVAANEAAYEAFKERTGG